MSAAPDIGTPPELSWLPVDKLDVDPSYQRTLDTPRSQKLIAKIEAQFDWRKFGALIAAPNEVAPDRFWLVDGQHRTEGARRRGDIRHLPAVVHRGLSLAALAAAFVGANRDRATVSAQALFHAQVLAGDPEAMTIKRLCAAADIAIERSNKAVKQLAAGRTAAVPELLGILRIYGEAVAGDTIMCVADVFRHQAGALSSALFRAAAMYLHRGGDSDALRSGLRRLGIRRIEEITGRLSRSSAARDLAERLGRPAPAARPPAVPAVKIGTAPPVKAEPLPAAAAKIDPKRAGEEDAIARFLAEKGARQVMSPEQVAAFLRDAGHQATIRIAETRSRPDRLELKSQRYLDLPEVWLDGRKVSLAALYQLANELRTRSGLPPLALPEAVAA